MELFIQLHIVVMNSYLKITVVGSSLTHHAALLVPPSGPMHPVVDHPQGDRQQQCVPSRAQKQPQSTW